MTLEGKESCSKCCLLAAKPLHKLRKVKYILSCLVLGRKELCRELFPYVTT